MCAVVGLALACVVNEVWLSPRPCPPQTAAWAEERAGGADSFPGWDRPAAYGLSGMGFAGQDYARMRGSAGQSLAHSASYRRGMQGIFRQYGPPRDMSEVLVQAAAVIRPMGKTPGQFASEIENSDRQTLWNKYGNNFSSKEEAKAAYDEFKRRRSEIPNDWPDSVK